MTMCAAATSAAAAAATSAVAALTAGGAQVSNGYLLKPDVEELIGRIRVVPDLREALEKSEARAAQRTARS